MQESMQDFLGIKLTKEENGYVEATMPVNERTKQPFGYLHGGANVVLAETVASLGAYALLDQQNELCFGLEINANHLRSKQDGVVTAKASIISKGKTVQVWEIKIEGGNPQNLVRIIHSFSVSFCVIT